MKLGKYFLNLFVALFWTGYPVPFALGSGSEDSSKFIERFTEGIMDEDVIFVRLENNGELHRISKGLKPKTFSNGVVPLSKESYRRAVIGLYLTALYPLEFLRGTGDENIIILYHPNTRSFHDPRPTRPAFVPHSEWIMLLRSAYSEEGLNTNIKLLADSDALSDTDVFNESTLFEQAYPDGWRVCLHWPDESESEGNGPYSGLAEYEFMIDDEVVEDLRKLIAAWQLAVTNENGLKFNPGPVETELGLALKKEIQDRLGVDMGEERDRTKSFPSTSI